MNLTRLVETALRPLLKDHTVIVLKRMDTHPQDFSKISSRIWQANGLRWLDLAIHGNFPMLDRLILDGRLREISLTSTKNSVLELLVNGEHDKDVPF
jgi:hypothetical protein